MKVLKSLCFIVVSLSMLVSCDMFFLSRKDKDDPSEEKNDNPYLTIIGLPLNTDIHNFSDVFVYNAVQEVAHCSNYDHIIITKTATYAAVQIPLVSAFSGAFRNTGDFIVSFTVDVDATYRIAIDRDFLYLVNFINGHGVADLTLVNGFFIGGLTNPFDMEVPQIKSGTTFEINGAYISLDADTPINPHSLPTSCLVYIYAVPMLGNMVQFIYSTTPPIYNPVKKGYYNESNRALFKFVLLKDSTDKYVAKTYIANDFTPYTTAIVDAPALIQPFHPVAYSLSGGGNPAPQTVNLLAGCYVVMLTGAGGGGAGRDGDYPIPLGKQGGFIAELVVFPTADSFTVYTGSGGGKGDGPNGGGGGSGSFIYSPLGYFLCAGGGGGGAYHWNSYRYSGGDGGSVGAGGAGDGAYDSQHWSGSGGGYGGGLAIGISNNYIPGNATYFLYSTGWTSGTGGAAIANFSGADAWKNTNGANGMRTQWNYSPPGGGNNRNDIRGGGAGGGYEEQNGGPGSVVIYKIF